MLVTMGKVFLNKTPKMQTTKYYIGKLGFVKKVKNICASKDTIKKGAGCQWLMPVILQRQR
jgi:hypothetical protein